MKTKNLTTAVSCDPRTPIIFIDKPDRDDMVCLSLESTLEAQDILSPEAFSLYIWFALYDNKEIRRTSSSSICNDLDLDPDVYMDAYNELLDNDYLTGTADGSGFVYFHDRPLVPPYLFQLDTDDINKSNANDEESSANGEATQ